MDGCYQIFKAPARLLVSAHLACVLFIHGPGNYSGVHVHDSVLVSAVHWSRDPLPCFRRMVCRGVQGVRSSPEIGQILHFDSLYSGGYNWFKDLVSNDACVKALVDR